MKRKEWFAITVTYKSGAVINTVLDSFHFERNGGHMKVTWGTAKKGYLKPLLMGVDEIESVWSRPL